MEDRDPSPPFGFPLDHVPVTPKSEERHPLIGAAIAGVSVIVTGVLLYLAPIETFIILAFIIVWAFMAGE